MEPGGNRALAGAVLVVLGLGLLALQTVGPPPDATIVFLVGGLFVVGYFWRRRMYPLLIPGCILLGLGLGRVGGLEWVGLGVGFLAIYLIDSLFRERTPWWPLLPGVVLLLGGAAQLGAGVLAALAVGWPLLLVLAGLALLATGLGIGRGV